MQYQVVTIVLSTDFTSYNFLKTVEVLVVRPNG
jgi:hypothetical protein